MQVYINHQRVTIFNGCTAQDAVRRLEADTGISLPHTKLYDAWGNVIADDSPMHEGRHIFTTPPPLKN